MHAYRAKKARCSFYIYSQKRAFLSFLLTGALVFTPLSFPANAVVENGSQNGIPPMCDQTLIPSPVVPSASPTPTPEVSPSLEPSPTPESSITPSESPTPLPSPEITTSPAPEPETFLTGDYVAPEIPATELAKTITTENNLQIICPLPITNLIAKSQNNAIELSWNKGNNTQENTTENLTNFYVLVVETNQVIKLNADQLSTVISGLQNQQTYSFIVYAANEYGTSIQSETITAIPLSGNEGEVAGLIVEFKPEANVVEGQTEVPGQELISEVDLTIETKITEDVHLVEFDQATTLDEAKIIAEELTKDEDVIWAEPDQFVYTSSELVNDPNYQTDQWNLWDKYGIGIGENNEKMSIAFDETAGTGVNVAVIDTGITSHPDLDSQIIPGYDFVSNPDSLKAIREQNGLEVSFDGDYVDSNTFGALGWDDNPQDPGDWRGVTPERNSSWHGTHIAGIIAAQNNNREGIAGIAPGSKIQPIRALSWRGGLLSDIATSITWASGGEVTGVVTNKTPAKVINMSFSVNALCPVSLQTAINDAVSRGSVLVAAAGNNNDDVKNYAPANCENVISVGASNKDGKRTSYSNYGLGIDVSAPGGDSNNGPILSTSNSGLTNVSTFGYASQQGTSIAAAHVSAIAARIFSKNLTATPLDVKNLIIAKESVREFADNACDINSDIYCGEGIVSLFQIAAACVPTQTTSGNYIIQTFTSTTSCTWTPSASVTKIDALLVAGGGGGGSRHGGGGGAGGVLWAQNFVVSNSELTISVGAGGNGAPGGASGTGSSGSNTTLKLSSNTSNGLTASGGGGGGGVGLAGGSGGGSNVEVNLGGNTNQASQTQRSLSGTTLNAGSNADGTSITHYGNNGGLGIQEVWPDYCQLDWCGGGGGGAGAVGGNATRSGYGTGPSFGLPGSGGTGIVNPISGSTIGQLVSGSYYIAGGGGGASSDNGLTGSGGNGGGGAGGNNITAATAGTVNTGGGGGGGGFANGGSSNLNGLSNQPGGRGGDGVLIIRYLIAPTISAASISGTTKIGSTLTASATTTGSISTTTYQWQYSNDGSTSWTNITGATSSTYAISGTTYREKYLRVNISVTNSGGSATANSSATSQIYYPDCSPTTSSASVSGVTRNIYSFTTTGTCDWSIPAGVSYSDVLVVGGGGGAGHNSGGGGSGGGVYYQTSVAVSGKVTIVVGTGGAAGTSGGNGTNGNQSSFNATTVSGGNAGIGYNSTSAGGASVSGSGLAGGSGAGGAGTRSIGSAGTAGSAGPSISITGTATNYAGGGGGGGWISSTNGGAGGAGGGGAGGGAGGNAGSAGTANTGGGGGSSSVSGATSGAGGSGIVVVTAVAASPTISSITPATGSVTAGASVTIAGTNFVSGQTTATINGISLTSVSVSSSTSMTAVLPNLTVGTFDLVVNNGYANATSTNAFTVLAAPTIASATISGSTVVGQTLTATANTVTGTSITTTYQWQSSPTSGGSYSNISGATSSTYTLTSSEESKYIKVVVTVTNAGGTASATSNATAVVTYATPTIASASISGSARIGNTLTASAGLTSGSSITTTYQWQYSSDNSSWSNIGSATNSTYAISGTTYLNKYLRVGVTVTNSGGSATAYSSNTSLVDYPQAVISYNASDLNSYSSSGTSVTDLSGNSINGTSINSLSYDSSLYAWSFPGGTNSAGAYIDVGNISTTQFNTSGITIDFEASFGNTQDSFERIIDFSEGGPSNDNLWVGREGTTSNLIVEIINGSVGNRCTFANGISENSTLRYTITLDGTTCVIAKQAATSGANYYSTSFAYRVSSGLTWTDNFIGKSNWSADAQYQGILRSFRIYAGSYTAAEIGAFSYKTITFDANSGSTPSPTSRTTSGKLQLPAATTRTGYTYQGWYDGTNYLTSNLIGAALAEYTPSATATIYPGWSLDAPTIASATISGTQKIGNTLTAAAGTTTGDSLTTTYQWQYSDDGTTNWTDISGATNSTYAISGTTYREKYLRAAVTVTNATSSATAYSTATSQIYYADCSPSSPSPAPTIDGVTRTVYSFTSTGTCDWTVPSGVSKADLLIVGGGGGGGSSYDYGGAGGGGGGQVKSESSYSISGKITISVGSGGAGGNHTSAGRGDVNGSSGSTSSIGILSALGGAGGYGSRSVPGGVGVGGAAATAISASGGGNGGSSTGSATGGRAGGGGGSSGAGGNATSSAVGSGGNGTSNSITGSSTTYGTGGAGGRGGVASYGTNGSTNTGNGGTGSGSISSTEYYGGDGGSGIVVISYAASPTVLSISPSTGAINSNTSVTITGTNFISGATVTIGGVSLSNVSVVSGTSITGTIDANSLSTGTKDVVVTTSSGTSTGGTGMYDAVNKTTPTLSGFSNTSALYSEATKAITAPTASVAGSFTYSSSDTSVASFATDSTPTATLNGVGSATITATFTPSNTSLYNSTSTTLTLTVSQGNQSALTVSTTSGTALTALSLSTSGGTTGGSVTYSVRTGTATSCSLSGSSLTAGSSGTCYITATMAGNTNYLAVSSSETTITFAKANQAALSITSTSGTYGSTITLTTSGGTTGGEISYSVAGSGNTASGCSITSGVLSATSAGDCLVTAHMAGTGTYEIVSSIQTTITFAKASVSLSGFNNISNKYYGDTSFLLTAPTASVAGSFTYTSSDLAVATISTATVTIVKAGTSTITASFTPTDATNYNTATTTLTLTINKKAISISAEDKSKNYGATTPTNSITNSTLVGSDAISSVTYTYSGTNSTTAPTDAGSYTITPSSAVFSTGNINNYEITYNPGTYTINKVTPTLSGFNNISKNYGDSNFSLTAPTASVAGSFTYTSSDLAVATISTATVTIVKAGTSTITASFAPTDTTNYNSTTTTLTLTISKKSISITAADKSKTYGGSTPTNGFSSSTLVGSDAISSLTYTYSGTNSTTAPTAAGSYTITPSNAVFSTGNIDNYEITYNPGTLTINKATPTFSGFSNTSALYSESTKSLTAPTPSVVGSFTYSSSDTSVASFSSSLTPTATLNGVGTSTITASFVPTDTDNYNSSSTTLTLTVSQGNQSTLTISTTSGTYGTALTLATTGGSGDGNVTYSATTGTASSCSISGSTLTAGSAGTCSVIATKASSTNYLSKTSSATEITFAQASQSAITISSTSGTYGSSLSLTISGGSGDGNVTYSATTGSATSCTVSGSTLTAGSAGTCLVTATKASSTNYLSASSSQTTISFAKASQSSLSVSSTSGTYGTALTLTTSGGSGDGSVSYSVSTGSASSCSLSGTSLTVGSAGTCNVTATKAESDNYLVAVSSATTVTFAKANQAALSITSTNGTYGSTITLTTSGGTTAGSILYAVAGSGNSATGCSVSSGVLSATSAGDCLVTATMAGSGSYETVSSSQTTITFAKASQSALSITTASGTYGTTLTLLTSGGSGSGNVTYSVSTGTASSCSVSGDALTAGSGGTCLVTATKAESTNYLSISSSQTTVTFSAATVTLSSFNAVTKTFGDTAFSLTAPTVSGSVAGTFSYTSSDTAVATISSSTVTIVKAGTSTITATFTPSDLTSYNSQTISMLLTIDRKTITITAGTKSKTYGDSTPTNSITSSTLVGSDAISSVTYTYSSTNSSTAPTSAGSYTITPSNAVFSSGNVDNYDISYSPGSYTINKATPTLSSFNNVSKTYGDNSFSLTAPTVDVSGSFTYSSSNTSAITISGTTATIAGAGSSTITASFSPTDTTNYNSTTSSMTITVAKASQSALSMTSTNSVNYGDTISLASSGGTGSGATTYVVSSGTCTISSSTLTLGNAGSTCVIYAVKASDSNYLQETSSLQTITINKVTPSLSSFSNISKTYGDNSFTITAPTVSGSVAGSFTYSSSNTTAASVSGTTVTVAGYGSSTITATFAPTDSTNYYSTTTSLVISVAKKALRVTPSDKSKNYGSSHPSNSLTFVGLVGSEEASATTFSYEGTGSTTYAASTTNPTDAGTYSITPSITSLTSGSLNNYEITYDSAVLTIAKVNQSALLITSSNTATFGEELTLSASGGSGTGNLTFAKVSGDCTLNNVGSTYSITPGDVGNTCVINATKALDNNYNAISSSNQTITIAKANQTLTFTSTPSSTVVNSTYTPVVTSTHSTSSVSTGISPTIDIANSSNSICRLAGSTVTFNRAGVCVIEADAVSSTNYEAATTTLQTITITEIPSSPSSRSSVIIPIPVPSAGVKPTPVKPVVRPVIEIPQNRPETNNDSQIINRPELRPSFPSRTNPGIPNTADPGLAITDNLGRLPKAEPGEKQISVDGNFLPVEQFITPQGNMGLTIPETMNTAPVEVVIETTTVTGENIPASDDGILRAVKGQTITVSGDGLNPGSTYSVWLFSTPTELGKGKVGADSSFEKVFFIPDELKTGEHTLQINGMNADKKVVSLTTGVIVTEVKQIQTVSDSNADLIGYGILIIFFLVVIIALLLRYIRKLKANSLV